MESKVLSNPLRSKSVHLTLPTVHPLRSAFISPAWLKVYRRLVIDAVSHKFKPVPTNLEAALNVLSNDVTLFIFHAPRSAFISLAAEKEYPMWVTEAVSQKLKPVPMNLEACWNVYRMLVTLATLHPLRSEFIFQVLKNATSKFVTEAVIHEPKPVPANLSAP